MVKKSFSIKQKTIFFVLSLISILLLILYFQNRWANKNYLIQIENSYKTNFDNFHKLFKKNLIDTYTMKAYHIKDNPAIINSLIKNDRFLKEANLIKFKEEKLQTAYVNEALKGKTFLDVLVTKDNIFIKVIVPLKTFQKVDSYVEYLIDSRVLLQGVKDFDGSNGLIYLIDDNKENDVFLDENENNEFFKQLGDKCQEMAADPVVKLNNNFYAKKHLTLTNYEGKEAARAIFFLDISKDKNAYIALVKESMFTSLILFVIAAIVVYYFFNYLIRRIEKNENKLKQINKNLEKMVEQETENRVMVEKKAIQEKQKSEQLLIQQSKLALLGEMIGNIAHQWRQPLMQLSAILMYLDAYNEKGKLTSQRLEKKIKDGNSIIDFMSRTIEDFRNYYKPEKQKEFFYLKESIDSALFILNSALKNDNIKVDTTYSCSKIEINSFKNEFSQALLNIITNAKDILIQRRVENPTISIDVKKNNTNILISLKDNGGGIDKEIIDKIFDPYFTTKHQSQGTGIGLYMTKMIIENNMNGTIDVANTKDGACFKISLKLDDE